jgi:hypothetical protein
VKISYRHLYKHPRGGNRTTYCIVCSAKPDSFGEIRFNVGGIWMCITSGSPGVWKEIK